MKRTLESLERELNEARKIIIEGNLYVHAKSGEHYQVIRLSLDEATMKLLVTYAPVSNTRVLFTRSMLAFSVKFHPRDQD